LNNKLNHSEGFCCLHQTTLHKSKVVLMHARKPCGEVSDIRKLDNEWGWVFSLTPRHCTCMKQATETSYIGG